MTPVETIRSLKLISSEAGQPVATAIHDIIHTLCLPILFSSGSGQETLINVYLQSLDCMTYDQNVTQGVPMSYQLLRTPRVQFLS